MTNDNNPSEIARLNDRFRKSLGLPAYSGIPGKFVMTAGIAALEADDLTDVLRAVKDYAVFNEDNDPYGEHDFGAFDHKGKRVFWKIDYYAPDLQHGSEDPADLSQTVRVLTILFAEEY